jgi:exodeoxyribonuclease VII large subunit
MDKPAAISLSELAEQISSAMRARFDDPVWVKAEIHKLNYYSQSGHCYPDLVEKSNNKIKAQMRATIWAGDYQRIDSRFLAVTRKPLGDNIVVLFLARVHYHPLYGLSLNIIDVDPTYTLGVLEYEKQKAIVGLKAEGLFDRNRGLMLPVLPSRLAIITVESSKGYQDFVGIIRSKGARFAISYHIFPALLQGDKAVTSLINALSLVKARHHDYDAVAIIRGGGGDIGLDCYNHPDLARQVALFPIPVLSGIGHSTNETIVEMIAHTNLITPTDLAYFLLSHFFEFEARLSQSAKGITQGVRELADNARIRTVLLANAIGAISQRRLEQEKVRTEMIIRSITNGAIQISSHAARSLEKLLISLEYAPQRHLFSAGSELKNMHLRLANLSKLITDRQEKHLEHTERQIQHLDPANILRRGYSITRLQGKVLKSSEEIESGSIVETELFKGRVISEVKMVHND